MCAAKQIKKSQATSPKHQQKSKPLHLVTTPQREASSAENSKAAAAVKKLIDQGLGDTCKVTPSPPFWYCLRMWFVFMLSFQIPMSLKTQTTCKALDIQNIMKTLFAYRYIPFKISAITWKFKVTCYLFFIYFIYLIIFTFLPMAFLVGPDGHPQPVVAQAVFIRMPSYLCCHLELITDPLLENLDSRLIGGLLDRKWVV